VLAGDGDVKVCYIDYDAKKRSLSMSMLNESTSTNFGDVDDRLTSLPAIENASNICVLACGFYGSLYAGREDGSVSLYTLNVEREVSERSDVISRSFRAILHGAQKSTLRKPKLKQPYLIHVVTFTGCSKSHLDQNASPYPVCNVQQRTT